MKYLIMSLLLTSSIANADQLEFCAGFKHGYKMVKRISIVPYCPSSGYSEPGVSDFERGEMQGMEQAQRD